MDGCTQIVLSENREVRQGREREPVIPPKATSEIRYGETRGFAFVFLAKDTKKKNRSGRTKRENGRNTVQKKVRGGRSCSRTARGNGKVA